jgi:hypothetical protein
LRSAPAPAGWAAARMRRKPTNTTTVYSP